MSPLEMSYEDRLKASDIGEKGTHFSNNVKERSSDKKIDKLSTFEVHPKTALRVAPCSGNGTYLILVLLQQKTIGNGMNRCSFSEEETTNAVLALNQIPAPVSQNNLLINPVVERRKLLGMVYSIAKLYKESVQSSLTNGSLNGVNQPMVSETDFLKLSKSSDLAAEKYKHKQKEKHRVDNCSNGGDPRKSKMKGKRDPEQDLFRASKKIRTESLQEDWVSDHVNIEKVGPSSSNGLPKNTGRSSSKDQVQVPARKPKEDVPISMDDVPMDMGNQIDIEVGKKRKKSRILAKEEFSENEYRKEKKARISRSDEKEASASKGSSKSNKKGSCRKNKQLRQDVGSTVSQRSLDGMDSLQRDSRSLHPSVAATSSSSKVSGSHKAKVNVHTLRDLQ
ncbi:hypothetical protein GH714_023895 [Hevea brasiliensis]|uniref:Uncharacterized protein n=1 Tax=Hevea brasiliensis TaxID=3981 RepID=A0A6A6LBY1_HEVBR|nr:hypothetical protein GH714_023895 [Hevea brasiliensis]